MLSGFSATASYTGRSSRNAHRAPPAPRLEPVDDPVEAAEEAPPLRRPVEVDVREVGERVDQLLRALAEGRSPDGGTGRRAADGRHRERHAGEERHGERRPEAMHGHHVSRARCRSGRRARRRPCRTPGRPSGQHARSGRRRRGRRCRAHPTWRPRGPGRSAGCAGRTVERGRRLVGQLPVRRLRHDDVVDVLVGVGLVDALVAVLERTGGAAERRLRAAAGSGVGAGRGARAPRSAAPASAATGSTGPASRRRGRTWTRGR